ncbi:MAG: NAD(P)/FAD-dependent oxidoreductase [Clostridia bacterium]
MINIKKIKEKLIKAGFSSINISEKNGGVWLQGELANYHDILTCGRLAITKNSRGVINDIKLKGYVSTPMRISPITDKLYDGAKCDALIVGGGIVGCAIARELSKYDINIMLVEKEYDLAIGQSSRNDGMIHAGIDIPPYINKVKYNMRGNKLYDTLSKELDVPIEKCGQTVLFTEKWQKLIYPFIKMRGSLNKIPLRLYRNKDVNKIISNAGYHYGAFFCGGAGSVSPYGMTVALAECAVNNGVKVCLNTAVLDIKNENGKVVSVSTNRGTIYPKVLINAAGIFSDVIAEKAGDRFFTIHPRKGVEAVLDSKTAKLTKTVIGKFAISTSSGENHSKGGGVVLTIDHNLIVGPSANETPDRENNATSAKELDEVFEKQKLLAPDLKRSDIITYFAGTRAATYEEKFIIEKSPVISNLVQAAGIQSPGVTAAPAIAEDITKWTIEILNKDKTIKANTNFNPIRKGIPLVRELPTNKRDALIKQNPDYGVIVCRCEQISKGEILDAMNSPIPALTIDGIKRRTRAGMGRCQGGFCSPIITQMIADHNNGNILSVSKKGEDSELLLKHTKGGQN